MERNQMITRMKRENHKILPGEMATKEISVLYNKTIALLFPNLA
jgi:hypothetical protein